MTREEALKVIEGYRIHPYEAREETCEYNNEAIDMAIDALSEEKISRAELFNKLATVNAPMEANAYKAEVYRIINEM